MIYFENVDGRVCIVFPYLGRVLPARPISASNGPSECAARTRSATTSSSRCASSSRHRRRRRADRLSLQRRAAAAAQRHDFTGRISRDHFVQRVDGAVPTFCLVGGKWTTFRAFGDRRPTRRWRDLGGAHDRGHVELRHRRRRGFRRAAALETELVRRHSASTRSARRASRRRLRHRRRRGAGLLPRARRRPAARRRHRTTAAEIAFLTRSETRAARRHPAAPHALAITGALDTGLIEAIAARPGRRARLGRGAPRPRSRSSSRTSRTPRVDRGMLAERTTGKDLAMRMSTNARMNRLFTNGRCLDVAIDHGVCNEPSFLVGLEDMAASSTSWSPPGPTRSR